MTHSIMSLGKAAALDPRKELVSPVGSVGASKCLQHFEVATGDPHPCPPTRQSMVSNLHPGWNRGDKTVYSFCLILHIHKIPR